MRRLVIFLCALLPFAASAQCSPSDLGGVGTKAVLELNATGGAAAWWCPGRFEPVLALYAVRWDAMSMQLRSDLTELTKTPDQTLAGIDRMRSTYASTPLESDGLQPVWVPASERIRNSRPPNPVWVVARNGAYPTRPTYQVNDLGRVVTPTATRATVGASCGCVRLRVIEGSSTYCGIDGESQLVAVCSRQPD